MFGKDKKKNGHAPINPATGKPNVWAPAEQALTASQVVEESSSNSGEQAQFTQPSESLKSVGDAPANFDGQASAQLEQAAVSAKTAEQPPVNFDWKASTARSGHKTTTARSGHKTPTASGEHKVSMGASRDPRAFTTLNPSLDELLSKADACLDKRLFAIIVLIALCLMLFINSNPFVAILIFVIGYALSDRFITARRAIVLGGSSWVLVMFLGWLISGSSSYGWYYSSLFMVCGFLSALVVCGVYFAGRAFYKFGFDRGQAVADEEIAQHIVDRLIENPNNVDNLDGAFLEVEGAISRVRDREHAQADALRDESRRKDDLVTYLAHDLKTPLASVVGYLSLLQEAPDLPEEQRVRFTGVALDKAHRLDTLIEEFFDITRFDFHDIVLTRGYVDLSLLLGQVADEFYPQLSEQGKQVEVEAEPNLTVLVDGDKMARVFNNVMKNAIAYSYEGSVIHIKAERANRLVRVQFINEGDPIPAPKLSMIFEKFYRLDAARATNRGGAGLGLAIAKEIVQAHGGTIACSSTPEHTVFTIELPE